MARDYEDSEVSGLIGWFAKNHVAANLLMLFIFGLGGWAAFDLKKESMPPIDFEQVQVDVAYPGAGPEEIESGILVNIEEALSGIDGIDRLEGVAREGVGIVRVDVKTSFDVGKVSDQVKMAVDGISTFPEDIERPVIRRIERQIQALTVQISGDLNELMMRPLADDIREEILALPEVTYAEPWGARPYEISVEISEDRLREFDMTLAEVANTIRRWSVDLPGGQIRTEAGNIRLRAEGRAYYGEEFADIALLTNPDGSQIRLSDIATINDGFEEWSFLALYDGEPSLGINVFSTEKENEIQISAAVRAYVEEKQGSLPEGIHLNIWNDATFFLNQQMNMLLKNMALGAVLVFCILGLFLRMRLAIWVLVGLPVAVLGAFMLMPVVGVTINIISLFAFILVLGIVVDDAIIIAEAAHSETERFGYSVPNIVRGAQRVAVPATFGVLTTVMAFLPMLAVTGPPSTLTQATAWVVIFCLMFSLVESKLILPSHLGLMGPPKTGPNPINREVDRLLKRFITEVYQPLLERAIAYRYVTIASFLGMVLLVVGFSVGGLIKYSFFPDIQKPSLSVSFEVSDGSRETLALEVLTNIRGVLNEMRRESIEKYGPEGEIVDHNFAWLSENRVGRLVVQLSQDSANPISAKGVENAWRERVGQIAGVKEIAFSSTDKMGGAPVAFKLSSRDTESAELASAELANYLESLGGLYEVTSSLEAGPQEINLQIKPEAVAMGVTLSDLARQVREAFYGAEAQRMIRDGQEVRVMVRYPQADRRSIGDLESMWIRLPNGTEVPFSSVAEYTMAPGVDVIRRFDKRRAIRVSASVDEQQIAPRRAIEQVVTEFQPGLMQRYSGLSVELDGGAREERESLVDLYLAAALVLAGIYALLAIPLGSYLQPFIIMSVIPFGLIGALMGHFLLGKTVSVISILGFVALAGVVVNDSLILVDVVNKKMVNGMAVAQAALASGAERFRAIVLTSLTTFFGLVPILFETSVQAQMVIPMAVSLAFGIIFSTVITLVLVPVLYNVLEDFTFRKGSQGAQVAAS